MCLLLVYMSLVSYRDMLKTCYIPTLYSFHFMATPTTAAPSTITAITNTETASSEATPGPYTSDPKASGCGAPPPPYSAVPLATYPVLPDQGYPGLSPDCDDTLTPQH